MLAELSWFQYECISHPTNHEANVSQNSSQQVSKLRSYMIFNVMPSNSKSKPICGYFCPLVFISKICGNGLPDKLPSGFQDIHLARLGWEEREDAELAENYAKEEEEARKRAVNYITSTYGLKLNSRKENSPKTCFAKVMNLSKWHFWFFVEVACVVFPTSDRWQPASLSLCLEFLEHQPVHHKSALLRSKTSTKKTCEPWK